MVSAQSYLTGNLPNEESSSAFNVIFDVSTASIVETRGVMFCGCLSVRISVDTSQ